MSETPTVHDTLTMFRPTLHDLPPLILPPGIAIRHMCAGEGPIWDAITRAAFDDETMDFEQKMRCDPACAPERVLFLEAEGKPVATASAWKREQFGPDCGYLHWVGTTPAYAGKGLGRVVALAALTRMREEGALSAVLHTQDDRIPAIKTYLRLGFHVCMDHPTLPARWAAILKKIETRREG